MIIPEKTLNAIQLIKQTLGNILSETQSPHNKNPTYFDDMCMLLSEAFSNEIVKLKRQRNTLSFISRLPPELFSNIIQLSNCDNKARRYSELSLVSHTWRRAIVADAKLWTDIDLEWGLDILKTILSRSKGAKLSVTFSMYHLSPIFLPEIESIFTARRDNIEKLRVFLDSMKSFPTYLNKFIGQAFPNLKYLTFCGRPPQILDGVPFTSDKSGIQTLDLFYCVQAFATDPLIAVCRNVRSLKLNLRDRGLYTLFLREAHTFTQLEELWLDSSNDEDTWHNDQTLISLPSLTTLLISGLCMTSIMTRLQTPKLVHYGIDTLLAPIFEPDWHPIFDSFDYSAIRFLRAEVKPVGNLLLLHISGCSQQKFPGVYSFYGTSSLFPKPCQNGIKWFNIELYDSASEAFLEALSLLLSRANLLCNLALDFYCLRDLIEPEEDDFVSSIPSALHLLAEAKTLQHLEMSADRGHFVDILDVLCEGSHCPKLETLVFTFNGPYEPTSEILTSFVESRGRTGVPLQLLALENCKPFEDEQCLMHLETLGTRVTFNAGQGFMIGVK